MNTKKEILDFLTNHKDFLKKRYHLSKIALFGSFAKDTYTKSSDVDILIEMDSNIENIHDIKSNLKSFLSKKFNRKVDIAREKYLKPYAKKYILKDAIYV